MTERMILMPMDEIKPSPKSSNALREVGRKARASGLISIWHRNERYVVMKGILIPKGKIVPGSLYAPSVDPSIPGELAKVHYGELTIEEFAGMFGQLGYSHLVSLEKRVGGDPVRWIRAHARTVAILLDLIGLLEEESESLLKEYLDEFPAGPYGYAGVIRNQGIYATVNWPRHPAATAIEVANMFLNPNIEGIRRKVFEVRGRARSYFTFRAMIQAIYWQLADKLENGGIRRCEDCKRFFVARDKRQRYCPPPDGLKRSRCASRFNVAQFRERRKK